MPVISTNRRQISEVLKTVVAFQDDEAINYSFARVMAKGSVTINPIGTILIYNGSTSDWELYVAQNIATEAAKSQANNELPDQSIMCITVGTAEGIGQNEADVTLDGNDQEFTVLFRGPAGITRLGVDANGSNAAQLAAAFLQFEKQGLATVGDAPVVTPSLVV